jgi:hypothetical protein
MTGNTVAWITCGNVSCIDLRFNLYITGKLLSAPTTSFTANMDSDNGFFVGYLCEVLFCVLALLLTGSSLQYFILIAITQRLVPPVCPAKNRTGDLTCGRQTCLTLSNTTLRLGYATSKTKQSHTQELTEGGPTYTSSTISLWLYSISSAHSTIALPTAKQRPRTTGVNYLAGGERPALCKSLERDKTPTF